MRQAAQSLDRGATSQILDEVVDRITEELQTGEAFDPEEYVRRYPELEEQLRKLLPGIQMLADLGHAPADTPSSESPNTSASRGPVHGTLGDYRIDREIGRGGMGVVYEAEQVSLGRKVALKVLPFAAMMDKRQLQRFQNEARAAASLRHPNIVQVHFVGCERAVHFYAMDYIEGQTLAEVIRYLRRPEGLEGDLPENAGEGASNLANDLTSDRFAPPKASSDPNAPTAAYGHEQTPGATPETKRTPQAAISTERSTKSLAYSRSIAEIGVQVAEALDHAHDHGVIHRDVKPSNVILDNGGKPWVTDFGLARIETDGTLTVSGDLLGTVRYMSPEQALAKRIVVDHRTDVYSLGVTLYELLTLQPVFSGQDRQELLRQIAFEEPSAPRRLNKAVPEELEIIVTKAMAKNPAERYDTAQELADDLKRFLEDRPIRARRPTLVKRAAKWSRRHKPIVWSAAVSTFLLLVLGLVGLGIGNMVISEERDDKDAALRAKTDALEEKGQALLSAQAERQRAEGNLDLALQALDAVYLDAIGKEKLLGKPLTSPGQDGDAAFVPQRNLSEFEKELLVRGLTFYGEFAKKNRETSRAEAHTARAYYRVALLQGALAQRDSAEAAYAEAINRFRALIRNEPENHQFHHELGQAYFALARIQPKWKDTERTYSKAEEAMTAAIEMKPDAAEYYHSRAQLRGHGLRGDRYPGREDAEKATELAPNNIEFHVTAATWYILGGYRHRDYENAIRHCEDALRLEPNNARAHLASGTVLMYVNPARGLEHLSRSIEIDPTDSKPFNLRAGIYHQRGDYERALSDANENIRLDSLHAPDGYHRRARIYISLGRFDEAMADLVAAEEQTPPGHPYYVSVLVERSRLHVTLGDYASAVNDLTRAIDRRPLSQLLYQLRSVAHYHLGKYDKALEDIKTCCRLLDGDVSAAIPIRLVATYPDEAFREGLLEFAEEDLARQVENQPGVPRVWINRANWYQREGAYDKAIEDYSQAIRLSSEDPGLYEARSVAYWELGRYDRVLADCNRCIALRPDDTTAIMVRAALLLKTDRTDEYRQACAEILDRFAKSEDPEVICYAVRACVLASNAVPDPMVLVGLAKKASRDPTWRFFVLGMAHLRAGQLDEATRSFQASLKKYPNWHARFLNWLGLALVHHERGETEEAQQWLKKAIESMEQHPDLLRQYIAAEGQLLRREVEQLLGKSDQEKDDAEIQAEE